MKRWKAIMVFLAVILMGLSAPGCNKYGCPTEIQATKVKKKKKLPKSSKSNLFSPKMRKQSK
jgi:hypothetical protein